MIKYYISTYYVNAYLDEKLSAPPTTIHIVLYIGAMEEEKMFYVLEESTGAYLRKYENMRLSECTEFSDEEISLEFLGEFFYQKLKELLESKGAELYQLEIYSSPTRRYKISDRLLLPFKYPKDVENRIEHIREWSRRLYSADKEGAYEKL